VRKAGVDVNGIGADELGEDVGANGTQADKIRTKMKKGLINLVFI
jgi:hypothetical protein